MSDPAPLTDAEREALEGAIADGRVSDSIIQHGPPKDHALLHRVLRAECARFVEHAAPTVERIVAARVAEAVERERAAWIDADIEAFGRGVAWAGGDDIKAEAWDAGYLARGGDTYLHYTPNPYRALLAADDEGGAA